MLTTLSVRFASFRGSDANQHHRMPHVLNATDETQRNLPDIRDILAANPIRDMMLEEDRAFLASVTTAVDSPAIAGGITRETLRDAFRIIGGNLPSAYIVGPRYVVEMPRLDR